MLNVFEKMLGLKDGFTQEEHKQAVLKREQLVQDALSFWSTRTEEEIRQMTLGELNVFIRELIMNELTVKHNYMFEYDRAN